MTLRRQNGATLIELMIGVTIGLLVTLVVAQAYLTGSSTQSAQNSLTRLQESGRFSLQLLSNEISKAGYRNVGATPPIFLGKNFGPHGDAVDNTGAKVHLVRGTDGGPANPVSNSFGADTLTLAFYGENDPSLTTDTADGHVLDCLGNSVTRDTLVIETLSIIKDSANNNEPTLACQVTYIAGTAGVKDPSGAVVCAAGQPCVRDASPLIPGVESLQVLYGVDTLVNGQGDGVVDWYGPAGALAASDWPNVLSVRVSLVVRSPTGGTADPTSSQKVWNHFGLVYAPANSPPTNDPGSVYTAPADGRYRLMFSSVVALRNYEY